MLTYHIIIKILTRGNFRELRSNIRKLHQCYLTMVSLPKKARPKIPHIDPEDLVKSVPHLEQVNRFIWKNIITHFRILRIIITDNKT